MVTQPPVHVAPLPTTGPCSCTRTAAGKGEGTHGPFAPRVRRLPAPAGTHPSSGGEKVAVVGGHVGCGGSRRPWACGPFFLMPTDVGQHCASMDAPRIGGARSAKRNTAAPDRTRQRVVIVALVASIARPTAELYAVPPPGARATPFDLASTSTVEAGTHAGEARACRSAPFDGATDDEQGR